MIFIDLQKSYDIVHMELISCTVQEKIYLSVIVNHKGDIQSVNELFCQWITHNDQPWLTLYLSWLWTSCQVNFMTNYSSLCCWQTISQFDKIKEDLSRKFGSQGKILEWKGFKINCITIKYLICNFGSET